MEWTSALVGVPTHTPWKNPVSKREILGPVYRRLWHEVVLDTWPLKPNRPVLL